MRLASAEIRRDIFNRSYLSFVLALMCCMALIGYGISQIYEIQKEQVKNNDLIAITNIYLAQVKAELKSKKGGEK